MHAARYLATCAVLALAACGSAAPYPGRTHRTTPPPPAAAPLKAVHDPGRITGSITSPCHARGQLPDHGCTPGAVDPAVTQADIKATICRPGYTKTVRPPARDTSAAKYRIAYPAYGIPAATRTELDHLVSLELGGDNDLANLWPESYPGATAKDKVENALHAAVCAGKVPLAAAQIAIAENWETAEARLGI
jgi:hypothetical protein